MHTVDAAPASAEVLAKLAQVEQNAWMLYSELPPCSAKTRALHVYLDAKRVKAAVTAAIGKPAAAT